jgi:hypothetical protein
MSGPTAATFGLDAGLLVAYEAMRAATAIAEGYAAERTRQAELRERHSDERQRRREATLAAHHALAEDVAREEARFRRLLAAHQALASQFADAATDVGPFAPALPARPATADDAALVAYLGALRARNVALAEAVDALSLRAAALPAADLAAIVATAPNLAEQLSAFAAQARLARQVPAAIVAARRADVERILARAALTATAALPEAIEALVAEVLRTVSDERAAALVTELRLRVARHVETAAAEAAARVLDESLRDLGYDVEGIGETLFVEGGVAHFQKAGWNDYFVRLRVDAGHGQLNFNVVRAGMTGEDRRHEDMLAEERWCAEFPRLRETLAARGIRVAVTRMLDAGQVPVQVVDADSLPRFADLDRERERPVTTSRTMQR